MCDHVTVRAYAPGVRRAHALCFPEERPEGEDETDDEFFDRVTFTHDEESVAWFLLCDEDEDDSEDEENRRPEDRRVVGFAAAVVYATSVYGMHVAVVPSYRGRGLGKWLMRETQLWAIEVKGKDQIQATVDASNAKLLRYYEGCGAKTTSTGFGSVDAHTPSVVRIARTFTEDVARRRSRRTGYVPPTAPTRGGSRRRPRPASPPKPPRTRRAQTPGRRLADGRTWH